MFRLANLHQCNTAHIFSMSILSMKSSKKQIHVLYKRGEKKHFSNRLEGFVTSMDGPYGPVCTEEHSIRVIMHKKYLLSQKCCWAVAGLAVAQLLAKYEDWCNLSSKKD